MGKPTQTSSSRAVRPHHTQSLHFHLAYILLYIHTHPEVIHELELEISRLAFLLSTTLMHGDPNVSEHEQSVSDDLIELLSIMH